MKRYMGWGLKGSQVQELLSLWSWDASSSWHGCVYQPESSPDALLLRFYGSFYKFYGHDPLLTPFPAPLPSLENMGGNWKSQGFNCGLVFLETTPIQKPCTENLLSRTKDVPHGSVCHTQLLQSCLTLCDPMDSSPPGSSVHGILQARILEWFSMTASRGSSQPRDWTWVSCIAGRFFTIWATWETHLALITYEITRVFGALCPQWDQRHRTKDVQSVLIT